MTRHYQILIVGGGTGGITVAARLKRLGYSGSMAILEPSRSHYYQPLWTLVAAGVANLDETQRPEADFIPPGVDWIQENAQKFQPQSNSIVTESSETLTYDYLIVATGLELNYDSVPGVTESLGKNGVITIYHQDQVNAAQDAIRNFKGGNAIFIMPPVPIKCAGAPQKIMYLADDVWRQTGVRERTKIIFAATGPSIFGIKEFAGPLMEVIKRKGIETKFLHKLIEVRPTEKIAVFSKTISDPDGTTRTEHVELPYDLLHVVPPMCAPKVVRESELASAEEGQKGWLEVDKHTLQHKRFPNVFGIGDVTGIPNSKTGAAIRKQAPVVARNVMHQMRNEALEPGYDGYSSCPLVTGIGTVMLAEFGYGGKLMPSFPLNPTKERRLYWHLKKDFLPRMYWHGMLKGRA